MVSRASADGEARTAQDLDECAARPACDCGGTLDCQAMSAPQSRVRDSGDALDGQAMSAPQDRVRLRGHTRLPGRIAWRGNRQTAAKANGGIGLHPTAAARRFSR